MDNVVPESPVFSREIVLWHVNDAQRSPELSANGSFFNSQRPVDHLSVLPFFFFQKKGRLDNGSEAAVFQFPFFLVLKLLSCTLLLWNGKSVGPIRDFRGWRAHV